jgi:hypothetical protein
LPGWVVAFDPGDWPIDAIAGGRHGGVRGRLVLMNEDLPLSAEHAETVQRSAWCRARRDWAREHRVSLLGLIKARRVAGVYDHLRSTE